MNGELPKQFIKLKNKPVLFWSLECFDELDSVDSIVVVLPDEWLDTAREMLVDFISTKPLVLVKGGARRQDSVQAGLSSITGPNRWVAVHDAARPGITSDLIRGAFDFARSNGSAVLAIPLPDTLVQGNGGVITGDIDRNSAFAIQTPQIFPLEILKKALELANSENIQASDDSGLVRNLGLPVHLFPGSRRLMKITQPEDLEILEAILPCEPTLSGGGLP